jgi:CBS domain-containing protein
MKGLQVKDTRVEEVMTRLFVALKPMDSIQYAAQRLARNHISGAPVLEHGKVVGVISESDIIRAAYRPKRGRVTNFLDAVANATHEATSQRLRTTRVAEAMSAPVITASPEMTISEAAALTERHRVKRLPVVDHDEYLIGVISRADLVRVLGQSERALVVEH